MKKLISSLALLVCFSVASIGQGRITVVEEPGVASLMNYKKRIQKNLENMEGWSVQLIVTTERYEADEVKVDFLRKYPNIFTKADYIQPTYRVRVGAFRTKLEATEMLNRIKVDYPYAYVVRNKHLAPKDIF